MSKIFYYTAVLNQTTPFAVLTTSTSSFVEVIGDDVYFFQDIAFNICIIPILSTLGMAGNTITMMVLFRRGFKGVTNIILAALSMNDFFFSLLNLIYQCKYFISFVDVSLSVSLRSFYYVSMVPVMIFSQCSGCVLIAFLAVERFVAVFFPFHASRIFRRHRVKWVVSFLFLYTLGLLTPYFFIYSYAWTRDGINNVTVAELMSSQLYNNNTELLDVYLGIVLNNLLSIVPLTIILVCSVTIVIKLNTGNFFYVRRTIITHKKTKSASNAKAVKRLMVVCVVHLLVYLPSAMSEIYRCYFISQYYYSRIWALLGNANYTLYVLSACLNVAIYVKMSSKFAAGLREICWCYKN